MTTESKMRAHHRQDAMRLAFDAAKVGDYANAAYRIETAIAIAEVEAYEFRQSIERLKQTHAEYQRRAATTNTSVQTRGNDEPTCNQCR